MTRTKKYRHHRHSKKCRHTIGGKKHHHRHSKNCRHMKGGYQFSPAPFSLGETRNTPAPNFEFKAEKYGNTIIPQSNLVLSGGRRKRRTHRGGSTSVYGFLPQGSGLSAVNSGLASTAPYISYDKTGGKKSRRHKKYRGGLGYGALASGSTEITASNSGMANYAPYVVYKE